MRCPYCQRETQPDEARDDAMLERRREGALFREIGAEFGVSASRALAIVRRAAKRRGMIILGSHVWGSFEEYVAHCEARRDALD